MARKILNPFTKHYLSLLDIQYSSQTNYFLQFKFGGVNALIYKYVMNADGTTTLVVISVVVAAAIGYGIHEATNNDDNDYTPSSPSGFGG